MSTVTESNEYAAAREAFGMYFRRNYPGPNTVISNPDWHSPKLFRAAVVALAEAGLLKPPATPTTVQEAARLILAQPKDPTGPVADAFHDACSFLADEPGAVTATEIIEVFLRTLTGDDDAQ